jgi:hypothetical protein
VPQKIIQSHRIHNLVTIAEREWEEPGKPSIFNLDADRLQSIFEEVQATLDNTHQCHIGEVSEDDWCNKVVQPTLKLALKMSGGISRGRYQWEWTSVQTSRLNKEFVSTLKTETSTLALDRKVDFALTLPAPTDPAVGKIYERIGYEPNTGMIDPILSHISPTDALSILPLFSGIEVKRASGDAYEAEMQCCVWSAASVNKKHQLQSQMVPHSSLHQLTTHPSSDPSALVMDLTRARVTTDSSIQLQPRTPERDLTTRSASRPASVDLSNPTIPDFGVTRPRPIVEQFDPEISIVIVGSLWKFFVTYHDINHLQASWNQPPGKNPVGFVGPVVMANTTNILELFKLLKILVAVIEYEDKVLKILTGERTDSATVGLVETKE